jgi:hypothetical protein
MSCSNVDFKRQLPLYEADLLDEKERSELENHLLSCDSCAEEFYKMLPAIRMIREMESPFVCADHKPMTTFGFSFRWTAVVAAAVLIIMVSGLSFVVIPNLEYFPQTPPVADFNQIISRMEQHWNKICASELERDPDVALAWEMFQNDRFDDCLVVCRKILEKDSSRWTMVILGVRAQLRLNRPADAVRWMDRYPVPAESERYPEFLFRKAQALIETGDQRSALLCLDRLMELNGPYKSEAEEMIRLLNPGE